MTSTRPPLAWQVQFLLLAATWGFSFLLIKVGDRALAPLQVALRRLLWGSAALRRQRLPRDPRAWAHAAVAGLLLNALPFTLFAYGETRVTSVLAGIWNATTPLLTVLVAMAALPEERPTPARIAGLGIGFAGVLVVLGAWRGVGEGELPGDLACLAAAACYGLGFPYARRHLSGRPEPVAALAAAQLLCAGAALALVTPFLTRPPAGLAAGPVAAVAVLGVMGTGIAYVLNYGVLRTAGATVASSVTYVVPLFSTAAGLLLLGEPTGWNQPLGAGIVLLGVAVSRHQARRRVRPTPISRSPP